MLGGLEFVLCGTTSGSPSSCIKGTKGPGGALLVDGPSDVEGAMISGTRQELIVLKIEDSAPPEHFPGL